MHHADEVPLEAFIDLLLDAIFVVDREGTILFVSAAVEGIVGYTPEEMIGRDVIDFVHPLDRPVTQRAIDEILGGQPKPIFENRYLHKRSAYSPRTATPQLRVSPTRTWSCCSSSRGRWLQPSSARRCAPSWSTWPCTIP